MDDDNAQAWAHQQELEHQELLEEEEDDESVPSN